MPHEVQLLLAGATSLPVCSTKQLATNKRCLFDLGAKVILLVSLC